MVEYTAAAYDVETGVEEKMGVFVEKKRSTGWIWKILVALLLIALCLGGARLFIWFWNESLFSSDPHHTLKQISSNSKAAIHLQGFISEDDSALKWADDVGHAFSRGGFKLVKNEIIIPSEGLYFVYSQASFGVTCSGDGGEGTSRNPTQLSHRIKRFSDSIGNETSVMSALRSVCQTGAQVGAGHNWYNAIYLGGVFSLNRGDRLWTETSPVSELEDDDGNTFFGVFAL
uniref:Tumor necrosis factor n=1 Tax=Oryzias melastigma TaxID=30732 RepID=A0A3B3CLI0_ORYME